MSALFSMSKLQTVKKVSAVLFSWLRRYVLLLLDTNSAFEGSIKSIREGQRKRLEPWTNSGAFDVMARKQTPSDVLSHDHQDFMGRIGRPQRPSIIAQKNAGFKLFADSFSPSEELHVLACLSARIGMDVLPLRTGQSGFIMAVKAVESSMRLLKRLQTFTTTIITMAPSEPLLALTSWFMLTKDNNFAEVLKKFKDVLLLCGYIEIQGGLGEFVCRLIINAAVRINLPQQFNDPENQLKKTAISVHQFLSQLIECDGIERLFSPFWMGPHLL